MKNAKFDIQGMTCSSCSAHVEKAVSKLVGVKKVNVNLLSNNMILEFDDKLLSEQDVINAIVSAGYGATLSKDKKESKIEKSIGNDDNIKSMKKRVIASACFLVPLMYIAMHHMFNEWFGLPIPQFINSWFHGAENALNFGFTQLLLLLPILYLNKNYFITGFKRLFKGTPNMDSLIALRKYGCYCVWNFCNIYDRVWIRT